jgi:hypothetical protein
MKSKHITLKILCAKVKEKKMANKRLYLGILAMVLVFGMTVVGCEDYPKDDYDDRPYLYGIVTFDNKYPVVGETITASHNHSSAIGTPSWRWYKTEKWPTTTSDDVENGTFIGNSNTYTVRQSDVGYWIWALVNYSGNKNYQYTGTFSTAIGIPATANVSVSMRAAHPSDTYYIVVVTLTLSDGRWNDVSYSTASQWLTMSGTPSVSTWYNPWVSAQGRELVFSYSTSSETTLLINNLTAALNTDQLGTMRSNTNVSNSLTAGTPATASVSQWTISQN